MEEEEIFIERQIACMDEIIKVHNGIKDIHESLEKLYPIAVIENGHFYIFDKNESGTNYEFKHKTIMPTPVYNDFLASVPLNFYDNKVAIVITTNLLRNSYNNSLILFHEFVHCFQKEKGELFIRKELLIDKVEKARNNTSWELNYPFPFKNEFFIAKTAELPGYIKNKNYDKIINFHDTMKSYLNDIEFEFMIWQEWKEGFARYVENLVRKNLGLTPNHNIICPPFGRVHLYEIGSIYIEMLINKNNELDNNILKLFDRMISYSYKYE